MSKQTTKERPILFSGPMVRAILEGRKTQTRRIIARPRNRESFVLKDCGKGWWPYQSDDGESDLCNDGNEHPYSCPFGRPGDLLWVRETWRPHSVTSPWDLEVEYAADGVRRYIWDGDFGDKDWNWPKAADRGFVPSIHMPRWASRITLRLTDVRVERLQEISEADAQAEGAYEWSSEHLSSSKGLDKWCRQAVRNGSKGHATVRDAFALMWDSTNPKQPYQWSANPYVWVLTHERAKGVE